MKKSDNESPQTRDLCSRLEMHNALVLPIVANKKMPKGWPDRYVHHTIWQGWLEFKVDRNCTELQALRIRELNRRKTGSAYVVRFVDESLCIESEDGTPLRIVLNDPLLLLSALKGLS